MSFFVLREVKVYELLNDFASVRREFEEVYNEAMDVDRIVDGLSFDHRNES